MSGVVSPNHSPNRKQERGRAKSQLMAPVREDGGGGTLLLPPTPPAYGHKPEVLSDRLF